VPAFTPLLPLVSLFCSGLVFAFLCLWGALMLRTTSSLEKSVIFIIDITLLPDTKQNQTQATGVSAQLQRCGAPVVRSLGNSV